MSDAEDEKKHIYYGSLDTDAMAQGGSKAAIDAGIAAGNIDTGGKLDTSDSLEAAKRKKDAELEAYEQKLKAKTMAVPTSDIAVKAKLRDYGEPICLFGEGPYERRERLRSIVAQRGEHGGSGGVSGSGAKGDQELFYTEGSEELHEARMKIAAFALPRTAARLEKERAERDNETWLDYEDRMNAHMTHITNNTVAMLSQVGDDRPLTCGKFSPNGDVFATTSWSGAVKLWNVGKCELVNTWRTMEDRCQNIAFGVAGSKTARHMSAACADGTIHVYDLDEPATHWTLDGHEDRVNRIVYHPTGDYLLSTSHDATWRLWDIERQEEILLQEGHAKSTYAIAAHPDGSLVGTSDLLGVCRIWDLRSGRAVLPLEGHVKQVLSCDFSPNGYLFATGSDDHTARIWDLRKRRCVQNLLSHNKMVSEVKFEPHKGRFLLSASYDCTLKMWSTMDWKCVKSLVGHEARVMGADMHLDPTTDRVTVGSVAFDRTFKFWVSEGKATAKGGEGPAPMEF